jgi:hypothetical protein
MRSRLILLAAVVLLGAVAAWSLVGRAPVPAPASSADGGRAELLAICEAVKPRGGSCRAPSRAEAAPSESMSQAAPARAADDPVRVRPVDVWGRAVRISIDSGTIKLESAGADGEFGDADDVVQRCPG